jgi:hypothetical protein
MKSTKSSTTLPLYYKGISGYTELNRIALLMKAFESPYRWWFDALRCSRDYWWVCQEKGKTLDPDLHDVWAHFGDVFSTNFDDWWTEVGIFIFAEKISPPVIEQLHWRTLKENMNDHRVLCLAVPLTVSDKTLKRQFNALLAERKLREIGESNALFPLLKTKKIRLKVIEQSLSVWLFRHEIGRRIKAQDPALRTELKLSLYEVGERLGVSPKHKRRAGEPLETRKQKERVMRIAVSRATLRASNLISNAEIGIFPSFEAVSPRPRWTPRQAKALAKAVELGEWSAPGLSVTYQSDPRPYLSKIYGHFDTVPEKGITTKRSRKR